MGSLPHILSLVGIVLYTLLWTATSAFYSRLGVDPQEIGINYASILVKSAGQILLLLVALILLAVVATLIFGFSKSQPAARFRRPRFAFAAVVVVVVAAWSGWLFYLAGTHAADVREGHIVPTTWWFFPYVPWRVWPAEVSPSESDPSLAVEDLSKDCVVYLGQGNGLFFFYDVDQNASLHVPTNQVIVTTQSRGERTHCPA